VREGVCGQGSGSIFFVFSCPHATLENEKLSKLHSWICNFKYKFLILYTNIFYSLGKREREREREREEILQPLCSLSL
jgi:hypothetical protein